MAEIRWAGKRVLAQVQAAAAQAIDRTMAACVAGARHEHPYMDRTGYLAASTDILKGATAGLQVSGEWGSVADYALFVEIGTSRVGPTAQARADADGGDMNAIAGVQPGEGVRVRQAFTILPPGTMPGQRDWITLHRPSTGTGNPGLMAPRPFLRPQADREYPLLPQRIREALR